MFANYHTHTYMCGHASGTPREYVEAAIKCGLKELGFSDHGPYRFTNGGESDYCVQIKDIPEYFRMLTELKNEYKSDINIYIGFEAEYYPSLFPSFLERLKPYPLDYLICGQHFIAPDVYDYGDHDLPIYRKYIKRLIDALKTGCYTYVAHPDLIGLGPENEKDFEKETMPLIEFMAKHDFPYEINLLGHSEKRYYPSDRFAKLAVEAGCKAIIGFDAHNPDAFSNPDFYKGCVEFAEKHGFTLIDRMPLRSIKNPQPIED